MNFATDLPPLINDLEQVSHLPDSEDPAELKQHLLHRQEVLLRVKDYLVFLVQQGDRATSSTAAPATDAVAIVEAVIQELQLKKTEWVAPISQEIDQLNAQKQLLEREIYRLNQQYEILLQQFPQQLLLHFQDLLQTQLSKAVELFEQRLRYISSITHPIPGLEDAGFAASEAQLREASPQTEDTFQTVQSRLDESLMSLDHTMRTVLGSLEQDVKTYQISLTEQIQRLHSLGTGVIAPLLHTAPQPSVTPTPESPPELNLEPQPERLSVPPVESPVLETLLAMDTPTSESTPSEFPAMAALFGADAVPYAAPTDDDVTDIDATTEVPETEDESFPPIQEQYLDFGATVTEDDLFGDRPAPEMVSISSLENLIDTASDDLPAESFLFGDPIAPPAPEPTELESLGLQAVIAATESVTPTATTTPESESTTVKTIKLLTDLLEDGALNIQEEETPVVTEETEEPATIEDLSPDLEEEDSAEAALPVTVLDPEQIDRLAEDLTRFEGEENTTVDVVVNEVNGEEKTDDIDNPWDNKPDA